MSVLIVMTRRMLEALLIAGVAMLLAAPDAMAAGTTSTESNPAGELWRAYPLEQTTTAPAASSTRPSNAHARSSAPAPDSGDGTPWIPLLLAACAVGLTAATFPVLRRRLAGTRRAPSDIATAANPAAAPARSPTPAEPTAGAARPAPATPAAIPRETERDEAKPPALSPRNAPTGPARAVAATAPEPQPTRPRRRAVQPAAAAAPSASANGTDAAARSESGLARRDSAARTKPASGAGERPRATARGPICQIRWLPKGRGSCFAAVTTGEDGVERTIATSLRIEWTAPTPPDDNPEAQAAIRHLAKTLRAKGWRPMRAKGTDFNEPQWYARRFRYPEPVAGDAEPRASERRAS